MHRIHDTTNLGRVIGGKQISKSDFQKGAQPLGDEVFQQDAAVLESDINGHNTLSGGSRTEGQRYPGLLKPTIAACYP